MGSMMGRAGKRTEDSLARLRDASVRAARTWLGVVDHEHDHDHDDEHDPTGGEPPVIDAVEEDDADGSLAPPGAGQAGAGSAALDEGGSAGPRPVAVPAAPAVRRDDAQTAG